MVVPSTTHKQFVQVVNAHKSVFLQYVHIAGCLAAWLANSHCDCWRKEMKSTFQAHCVLRWYDFYNYKTASLIISIILNSCSKMCAHLMHAWQKAHCFAFWRICAPTPCNTACNYRSRIHYATLCYDYRYRYQAWPPTLWHLFFSGFVHDEGGTLNWQSRNNFNTSSKYKCIFIQNA